MISSSNRSVMVSKSAKVSIWKERDETGTEGAVATRPGSAHKPIFLHQASGHILGLCPCLTFGLQIRIQHQEKKPSTGAFQIGLTMGSLFLGETTGSTLQRKVVKIKRANRCKASKTLEIIFSFLFLTCLSLHPAEYMALYRAGVREKAKGPTTKRGAMRLTSSVHLLTILCMAPMFHGHETLQLQAVLCLQRILSVIHLKSPGLGISDNTQPHLLVMDSCKSRLP